MAELLKMSELVARSGVEKSTIQHYLREGLLPGPAARPHRNMAYYSPVLVERIGLIRQLQTKQRLPLGKIKKLLGDHENVDEVRRWLVNQDLAPEPVSQPVARRTLLAESGLTREQLDRLESMKFLRPTRKGRQVLYSPNDVAVVRAIAVMWRAGLSEKNGFELDDMLFYLENMRNLVFEELALFTRVMGKAPRDEIVALAEAGLDGTSSLLLGLRRRILLDLVQGDVADDC